MRTGLSESERRTRRERVDPRLKSAGWKITAFRPGLDLEKLPNHAVTEYPTKAGPADYALVVDGQILGIVEAKKVTLGPQGVLQQAERYSKGATDGPIDIRGYHVPFLYSTNGEVTWHHDIRNRDAVSRRIAGFHTPAALKERFSGSFEEACKTLAALPNVHERLRPYQIDANDAIEKAIAGRKRQMLVAMATGTGKTFTLVNEIYRLMKSGVAKRILFLVDRRALAAQAVRAFASFAPEPNKKFDQIYEVYSQSFQKGDFEDGEGFDPKVLPNSYLTDPKPQHAFVYVCTIQRMAINLFGRGAVWSGDGDEADDDADQVPIPIHAFDVVVADECHRGYTAQEESLWRNTLDHFDAVKIGLTATPASHTTAYFKDVVYRYDYARAVREGFLVDYDAVSITSDVKMKGVFLKEGERVSMVDTETGLEKLDEIEDERDFDATEVERKVTAPDSNRKILKEIAKYAEAHKTRYGRFPKTLIFAANDLPHISHADQLVEQAKVIFGGGEEFARKITGKVDRPLQRIREFRNRPNPSVVVTVDLLSTGVDIPDLEFIVFLRPVKSRILFEQMLGRGTRKGDRFPDKSHFTVFDCFAGTLLEYFKSATAITAELPEKAPRTIAEVIEDIWKNRDREYNVRCLVKRLRRIEKEMAPEARALFAAFGIADGDLGRYATELPGRLGKDFTGTMKLLRDKEFQAILVDYPRPKKVFTKADGYEDDVSSELLMADKKPEDYLKAFADFVKKNEPKVKAIEILLAKPKAWSTTALEELRAKLATAPEHFTLERLEAAHRIRYGKALVDIISMVKHAAREQEPLLTASERVDRACMKLEVGRTFNPAQAAWMERIRQHLIVNLTIDEDAFEWAPVLVNRGGWGAANKAFDGALPEIIRNLNEAIAA